MNNNNAILEKIINIAESMAQGNFSAKYNALSNQDQCLELVFNQITNNLNKVIKHMNLIAQGRYDIDFVPLSKNDELGISINNMTEVLREMSNENKRLAWIKSGQAELSNIVRGDQDAFELGKNIVSFLARYSNALVGTIYQVSINEDDILELIGSFAIQKRSTDENKIKFGEGLIGQCAIEKEQLIFSDIPSGYLKISSSIGEITPNHIIVTPFLIEKEIIGVMELGALEPFDMTKIELLRQVSENIAIALKSSQNNKKLKILLATHRQL